MLSTHRLITRGLTAGHCFGEASATALCPCQSAGKPWDVHRVPGLYWGRVAPQGRARLTRQDLNHRQMPGRWETQQAVLPVPSPQGFLPK